MVNTTRAGNSYQEELTPISVVTSERKEFAPLEEQILSLKSSSHVEGLCPSEKQPGNFKFCLSLCSNGEKTWCTYALTTQYHCMEKMNGIITMI